MGSDAYIDIVSYRVCDNYQLSCLIWPTRSLLSHWALHASPLLCTYLNPHKVLSFCSIRRALCFRHLGPILINNHVIGKTNTPIPANNTYVHPIPIPLIIRSITETKSALSAHLNRLFYPHVRYTLLTHKCTPYSRKP